ncbi:two-component regulator propeller domain-containing protein [Mariniflexile gromovii]|uniref:histidine kinase n=1 Tax=Mariniflexile gromovii TaxID=362523 RepID=A0ABS4BY17_9FLAO|nr:two-component regulator propeller domain-containing protein [Mariniflexile gromovii]MBP0904932.1 response regulator [Mariniflexile gromovii]
MLFTLTHVVSLHAQNFERFSNKEGFNQNTITSITQDKYGFLWFGTPNGLIKYDGYEFETYTTQSQTNGQISSNNIKSLYNDNNGVLWVGTNVGITIYIPWLEKFYQVPLLSKLDISHITSDDTGNIWFSGENKLHYCKLTDTKAGLFSVSDNLLTDYPNISTINSFNFIPNNKLLLATDSGIKEVVINTKTPKQISINSLMTFTKIDNTNVLIIKKIKDKYWIGTENGLYQSNLSNNNLKDLKKINQERPIKINTIFEDANKDVWVGTKNNGLFKYLENEDRFLNYDYDPKNPNGLSSNQINTIYQDNYGVLWMGTAQGGINKLDLSQKQFITYTKNPYDPTAITDNLITSIIEDNTGKLWLSVYNNNDILRSKTPVNDKTVNHLKFENLIPQIPFPINSTIRCIYEDQNGYIWFGTSTNTFVYNPLKKEYKTVAFIKDDAHLPEYEYRDILQIDNQHIVFVGSKVSVIENPWSMIQQEKVPKFKIKAFLKLDERTFCHTIIKDHANRLWIGTNKGLLNGVFDGHKLIINDKYSDENKDFPRLSYANVFSLHEDQSGNIWAGTFGGGLNKISLTPNGDLKNIEYFRKNDVLPDDAIYGILQNGKDDLWLSTDMGLVKFNMQSAKTDVFDVRDGLAQNNFRQAAYFKGTSGYYYFGGLNGLTIFKPNTIHHNRTPPKIIITSLLINNNEVKIGEKLNNNTILNKSIAETESIAVSQNEQSIAFQLVVEHSTTPTKNKFAYKLEGFNDNWLESEKGKNTITYTNLSAGEYIFKIKAANGDGIWSSKTKNLAVKILPPWYQTWWSYLLFAVLTILICAAVMIYLFQHERLKQKLIYEQRDKERIDTINQGKFRYFTNISHEFRTPLTLISGPLEQVITKNKDDTQSKYLAIIQKNTKRLLSLVDQLITFRQAEQGYISLNLSRISLADFIHPTTIAFENYAEEKQIDFYFNVLSPDEEIIIDIEKVERILFNLLSNSFKNTPANGRIGVEADIINSGNDKEIKIDVIDTGRGIPEKDLANIFERFYQLGTNKDHISGGGIGLAFCKSLIDLFKGEIAVTSQPHVETRFSIKIPSTPSLQYDVSEVETLPKSYIKNWVPLSSDFKADRVEVTTIKETTKRTILIVEDEEDVQLFLNSYFKNDYNILIAQDGLDALSILQKQEPDLIISDVMMPNMDGFAFCEKVKSDPNFCHIPILLLTALGDDLNLIKGLEYGADEYISKPFSLKHLALRADKLIKNNLKLKEHFKKKSTLPIGDIRVSERDEKFLNNIITVIEKNISDSNFGVEELASELGISTSHFYRRIKQLTGQVPNVYLRNFRLQRAAELLKSNKDYNVTEVMYQIGIESPPYFSTAFKKLHGVSPSQFLKN